MNYLFTAPTIAFTAGDRVDADYKNPMTRNHEIMAIGRLSKLHGLSEAEFALLLSDPFQRLD